MSKGIVHARRFAAEGVDPFGAVAWREHTAQIKDEKGAVVFEQAGFRVPASWSDLAANVVAQKFAHGPLDSPERESGVDAIVRRVVSAIRDWGLSGGVFDSDASADAFADDLAHLCLNQYGAFNSPVWFNVGVTSERSEGYCLDRATGRVSTPRPGEHRPQGSACFIQSVADDMGDIMRLASSEAMLFKRGSGTGTDLSTLRSTRERLSGGGRPSGPVSFFKVYDSVAGIVKSGGKTRRAARMQTLKCWHPDILDFIECKMKAERLAKALVACGFDGGMDGEVYASVPFQNTNTAVRVTDDFMRQAASSFGPGGLPDAFGGSSWAFRSVTTGEEVGRSNAGLILRRIAEADHYCGDPGLQYEDAIQRWHTCPEDGPINSSNPCSEYMFLDDSACNLASVNLMKFRRPDGTFDAEGCAAACRIFLVAQEILVDNVSYPTRKIAENSHRFRPLGLGYANLGALVMTSGLAYDSDEGRTLAAAVTSVMNGSALLASAELAAALGPYEGFARNREHHLRVARMHSDHSERVVLGTELGTNVGSIADLGCDLHAAALSLACEHGFRNAQVTLLAPTGTIAFMMDCDTTGIEPDIALVKYKSLAGGGMLKLVNRLVPLALETLGYEPSDIGEIVEFIDDHDTISGCPFLLDEHLPVFATAFGTPNIHWRGHVEMMAAVQPFLSGAISKTVNMPNSATVEDVEEAFVLGWDLGLKALAIFRDGSKGVQPVKTSPDEPGVDKVERLCSALPDRELAEQILALRRAADGRPPCVPDAGPGELSAAPSREKLPETCDARRGKFRVGGFEGYVHAGLYPDGRVGEVFVTAGKDGSTLAGLLDFASTMASLALQHGCPLESVVEHMRGRRFEPHDLRASSIPDAVGKWLESQFLADSEADEPAYAIGRAGVPGDERRPIGPIPREIVEAIDRWGEEHRASPTGKLCQRCSCPVFPNGSKDCYACPACGDTQGACGG